MKEQKKILWVYINCPVQSIKFKRITVGIANRTNFVPSDKGLLDLVSYLLYSVDIRNKISAFEAPTSPHNIPSLQ